MKENQNGFLYHSQGCARDADPSKYERNAKDEFLSTPEPKCSDLVDDLISGSETEIRDSPIKDKQDASKKNDRDEFWNTTELECLVFVDDFMNGNENETRDSVAPFRLPSELPEGIDLYTDKNVKEYELPELIVCYKECTYHVVKDICIDEVVLSEETIFSECAKKDKKRLCNSQPCNENNHGDKAKESVDIQLLIPDGLKSSSGKDCDKDAAEECETELVIPDGSKSPSGVYIKKDTNNECGADNSMQIGEAHSNATDKKVDDASREDFAPICMLSDQDFGIKKSLRSLLESLYHDEDEVEQQTGQISCVEANSERQISESLAVVSAADESSTDSLGDNLFYNSKLESRTITFDSYKTAASSRDVIPENVHEQPLASQKAPNLDDGISDNLSVASQVHHDQGESSFSVAGPVSGIVSYSGPIAYSGSLSLRSDSSTTSSRSFAFPILQAEWNSSPVRMAKADRRYFRKHKGWRQCLLCCRF